MNLKLHYGELFQHEHSKHNVIFIAGGTGITPFLSAFNDPSFADYNIPKLYLGVGKRNYYIYEKDLALTKEINPVIKIKIKYREVDGILDIDRILNENAIATTYFISGPQVMISYFKSRLIAFGVKESYVKTDEWE